MPESFDSMLAELADAAGGSVALPDLAAVHRRAGQRTVRRRMTASAIAFALLCVTGVAGAAIDGRFGRPGGVNAASAPSVSSEPSAGTAGATGAAGSATPTPSGTASSAAGAQPDSSFVGVWETSPAQDGYLLVFPDGVVGLSEAGGASLCYGRVSDTRTAAQVAASDAAAHSTSTASIFTSTSVPSVASVNSTASPTLTPSSYTFTLPFGEVACDNDGVAWGLTLAKMKGESALTLTLVSPSKATVTGSDVTYSRVLAISSAATPTSGLKQYIGDWSTINSDGTVTQSLRIESNGSVVYTNTGATSSSIADFGEIDSYYSVGARVLTGCSKAGTTPYCGVLLLQPGATASEMTVYSGSGPATFTRDD